MSQIPAMSLALAQEQEKEGNVMTKLLGVIAGGCNSANLEKTETGIENMADGDGKFVAQKEIAAAQDSLLNGKMGACGAHLNKAMHATMK